MFVSIQLGDKIVIDCAIVRYSCVLSDGYIASFDLLWISNVFCAKHGYIGSFELN
jgi:energy-converting hydrogenase Eha subunit B